MIPKLYKYGGTHGVGQKKAKQNASSMEARELWLLAAALAVSLLYYLAVLRRYAGGRGGSSPPLPPGPTPLPLIGNLLSLRGVLHHRLASLARVHGPVMTLRLGLTTAVVISSRDAAAEAYTKHDRRLAARVVPDSNRAHGFSDRSIIWLPSSDPRWKTLRGIQATHLFSPRGLAAVRAVRESKVRDIVAYFRSRAGEEVLFGEAIYSGVLNLVSSSFFSVNMAGVGSEEAHGLRELVEDLVEAIAKPNVSDLFPVLRPLDLQGLRRRTEKRMARAFDILDGIIDRRLASAAAAASTENRTHRHGDFLDALLDLVSEGKMARDHVTIMLFEVFGAGSDTMSVSLEWAMAELLRNPVAMRRARAELKDVLGDYKETGAVEEADAARLPYLQAVVKEAMRLHPVGPILLPHRAVEDGVEIGGHAVPRGAMVLFNAWAIMRDPAAWEAPDEFVPERFMERTTPLDFRGKEFEYIPFGSGRRLCPGLPLAERVVPFVLASLLRAFEWRLPDGMTAEELDVSERFNTANVLAVPLKVVPIIN